MRRTILLAGALGVMTAGLLTPAQALPVSGMKSVPSAGQSLVEKASWRCWRWRHICAHRWGWGTWRYERCLARHAC